MSAKNFATGVDAAVLLSQNVQSALYGSTEMARRRRSFKRKLILMETWCLCLRLQDNVIVGSSETSYRPKTAFIFVDTRTIASFDYTATFATYN